MAGKVKTKTFIKNFPVSKLIPYRRNPRINKKAVDAVAKSIQRVGNNDPIEINEKNVILCGHTRKLALEKLGIKTTDVIMLSGLTEKQQNEYRITNNKTGELAEWDFEILEADFSSDELLEFGFDIKDLTPGEIIEDEAPSVPKKARTVRGDIYTLGNHRVMCGDSSSAENMKALTEGKPFDMVFTDPPYGVSYADKNQFLNTICRGNCIQEPIKNDHLEIDDIKIVWGKVFKIISQTLSDYSCYYICAPQGGDLMMMMMMMMTENGLPLRHTIIWKKNNHVLGRSDYNYKHEPILYGWTKKHKFYGGGDQKYSVWDINKPLKSDLHPTMKPVELIVNAVLNSTEPGMIVGDPFLGSGSTLIACEQTNRTCYGMELDEKYCDVIVQRWVNFTGGDVILNGKKIKWGKTDGRAH